MENKGQTQFLIVDWFQFTILDDVDELHQQLYVERLFKELFNISSDKLILENSAINGYKLNLQYLNIKAYFHPNFLEKGINFLLSGQACRDFENLGISWQELCIRIKSHSFNINRIDIAIDDFTNDYFDLNKISYYRSKSWIRSQFKTSINIDKNVLDDNSSLGRTIQFGSKASLCEITFYDKKMERHSAGYEVNSDINFWTRTELRFRHEYALQIYDYVRVGDNIEKIVKGILYDKIQFLKENKKDKNKSRWKVADWYLKFLDNVEKLKLTTRTKETSITRKKEWFSKQVAKSFLQIIISDMIDLSDNSVDFLRATLKKDYSLKDSDINLINEERIKKGLSCYNRQEIIDYIKDINDIVLINDKTLL